MNEYKIPIIGRVLRDQDIREGERLGSALMIRGWSAARVLDHGQRAYLEATEEGDDAKAYQAEGIIKAAKQSIELWGHDE